VHEQDGGEGGSDPRSVEVERLARGEQREEAARDGRHRSDVGSDPPHLEQVIGTQLQKLS